ncbi:MAG TPA: hypothetical protein VGB76_14375 [Pyrinomonadaceae bacterium]|jgi:hypothetical protein
MKLKWHGFPCRHSATPLALLLLIVGCVTFIFASNHQNNTTEPAALKTLFDFTYVGIGEGGFDPSALPHIPKEELSGKTLPDRLAKGHQYVFIRAKRKKGESMFELIQSRLTDNGASIEQASCCILAYAGDPVFMIRFRDKKYKGVIYNALNTAIYFDTTLREQYDGTFYVLVVEEELSE